MDQGEFSVVIDGDLGGCGYGEHGDPRTWLPGVWDELLFITDAESVLDLGCGFGYSTKWFWDSGLDVVGLEGSRKVCDRAVSICVRRHDFTEGKVADLAGFDLCWCSEFLEHISDEYESCYFDALTKCRYVALSAATPGQGGHHHVNERTCEYWIGKFKEYGFEYDEDNTALLRSIALNQNPSSYFAKNGLFFKRARVVEVGLLWTDIDGWLTKDQGDALRHLVKGKRVLEIGSYKGRSTVCMAQVAEHVTSVDDHRNGSLLEYTGNIRSFGLSEKVESYYCGVDTARDSLLGKRYDVVYIDGSHDEHSVAYDTEVALDCLVPGGLVVWHDYNYESVKAGVGRVLPTLDMVKDLNAIGVLQTAKYQVMVVMPHCGDAEMRSVKSAMRGAVGKYADQVGFLDFSYGCLTHNFNVLLSYCLGMRDQGRVTHMAMLHSDVWSDQGWVDVLAEEMSRSRATVVSAVVAIKDPNDDRTSTAIGDIKDPWSVKRFIRLNEEGNMPETFGEDDVCEDESEVLLVNTGCMLIDLSDDFWDGFAFKIYNRIIKDESGVRCPQFRPEDWEMSRELRAANRPYVATWKVKTRHIGVDEWENRYEDSPILDCV